MAAENNHQRLLDSTSTYLNELTTGTIKIKKDLAELQEAFKKMKEMVLQVNDKLPTKLSNTQACGMVTASVDRTQKRATDLQAKALGSQLTSTGGLSKCIEKVIDANYEVLLNDLTIDHLVVDLNVKGVLNYDEIDELQAITTLKKKNEKFLCLLRQKSDYDFYSFCNVLKENQAMALQNLGRKLKEQARSGDA